MDRETIRLVMIGHLDHGKSTLIGRLLLNTNSLPDGKLAEIEKISGAGNKEAELSFLVDQLKEERLQNRTIETTQINFKTDKRNYVLIDVPGHAEFIKNMLTGASMADAAVLIVDGRQGIREQTRGHAYLIKLLGMQKVVVAVNKMDLVKYERQRFEDIKAGLLKFFKNLGISACSILPISAKKNQNITARPDKMSWYKGPVLLQALERIKSTGKPADTPLRFCVQDIFKTGQKYWALGKMISGRVISGEKVLIIPSGGRTKVASIKTFAGIKKSARGGENVGIMFEDNSNIRRGQIITGKDSPFKPVYKFRSTVFWISKSALRLNKPFVLRFLCQEARCLPEKIEKRMDPTTLAIIKKPADELNVNQAAEVVFKTTKPVAIENFSFIEELGRFVIERRNRLCGIGIVNDPGLRIR